MLSAAFSAPPRCRGGYRPRLYNFGIPSQLKARIDRLAVAGRTFRYTELRDRLEPHISFPGLAYVRAMTRAPANVDRIDSVRALTGLRSAGSVRFSGSEKERQLSAGPVPSPQSPARPQEGDHGCRWLHPDPVYHILKDGTMYQDLGRDDFKRHSTDRLKKRLLKGLADLDFAVELKPLAA
jgi:Flavodoxin-like fold